MALQDEEAALLRQFYQLTSASNGQTQEKQLVNYTTHALICSNISDNYRRHCTRY
jgi:hypothetical protein